MTIRKFSMILFISVIVLSTLACNMLAQPTPTPEPTNTPAPTNTPVPTDTPEPTATQEPTATPKPTETVADPTDEDAGNDDDPGMDKPGAVPDGELGIAQLNSWETSSDYYIVTGLVTNNTARSVDGIEIEVESLRCRW